MLERVLENTGARPVIMTADTGYLSESNVTYYAKNGVDAYISLRKSDSEKLTQVPSTAALMAR